MALFSWAGSSWNHNLLTLHKVPPQNPASAAAQGRYRLDRNVDWSLLPLPPTSHLHTYWMCGCAYVCACIHRVLQNLCTICERTPAAPTFTKHTARFRTLPSPCFLVYSLPPPFFYSGSFCEINSSLPIFGLSTQGMESFFKGRCSRGRETDWVVAFFWVGKEQD